MFQTVVIHSEPERTPTLRFLVQSVSNLTVIRDITNLSTIHEFQRMLNTLEPDVVIFDFDLPHLLDYTKVARQVRPEAAIIAVGFEGVVPYTAFTSGLNAVLSDAAPPAELQDAVEKTLHHMQGGADRSLYCFLPGKAGSGCSTIVLNTAIAAAREHHQRVLVIEADLRSGILSTLLNTRPRHSTEHVLSNLGEVTTRNFSQSVVRCHNVDFLLSSRNIDNKPPDWSDYFHLLGIVRAQYDLIFVDLPEVINPATIEIVRRSAKVFLVTTPELPSLTLARQRAADMLRLKLDEERLHILVNRWHKSDASQDEIADLLGLPVSFVIPNDYPTLRAATLAAGPVMPRSKLGQAYIQFSGTLLRNPIDLSPTLAGKLKSIFRLPDSASSLIGRKA